MFFQVSKTHNDGKKAILTILGIVITDNVEDAIAKLNLTAIRKSDEHELVWALARSQSGVEYYLDSISEITSVE